MMRATVHTVDDGIGGAFQLIIQTPIDQPADHRHVEALARHYIARRAPLNAALGQGAVNAFDDITALTEFTQRHLGRLIQRPLPCSNLMGETEPFQPAQASNLQGLERIRLPIRRWRHVDNAVTASITLELPVKLGPVFGIDLAFKRTMDFDVIALPKLLRHHILGAGAQPVFDVIP